MVRVNDIFCLNLMKKYVVWGCFFREGEKVILIRMMFKIRVLFFDFLVNIILRVYFIDLCGWVRWEFCSCFCEM